MQELLGLPGDLLAGDLKLTLGQLGHKLRIGDHRGDHQIAKMRDQLRGELLHVVAVAVDLIDHHQRALGIMAEHRLREIEEVAAIGYPEHLGDLRLLDALAAEADDLIEQTQRVAHAPGRLAGHDLQGGALRVDALLAAEMLEVLDDVVLPDPLKVKALAAAQDRDRNLLRLGRRKDKARVVRRLLQGLQQRVEGLGGEHVHFIDDVDLVAVAARRIAHPLAQLANLVDAAVRRAVDLKDIDRLPLRDLLARRTLIAGRVRGSLLAVERLGQNARRRGLAHPARPAEEVGVVHPILRNGVLERAGNMALTHHLFKMLGAPLPGQHLVRHRLPYAKRLLGCPRRPPARHTGLCSTALKAQKKGGSSPSAPGPRDENAARRGSSPGRRPFRLHTHQPVAAGEGRIAPQSGIITPIQSR